MKIKTNPLSVETIKSIANNIRDKYHIPSNEYFPILEVLDKMMMNGELSYQIVDEDYPLLSHDELAIYNPNDNFIYIKESVIEEYENNIYRANFTLAHELFHYLQAQVLFFDFEEVENCPSYMETEWQANEFAAQLLIPEEYLALDDNEIAKQFHVSLECVETRKLYLKRRTNRRKED